MRILIDALAIMPGINGGAVTYVSGMVNALAETAPGDRFLVIGIAENRALFRDRANLAFRPVRIPQGRLFRLLYEQFILPLVALRWRADAVLFPGNLISLFLGEVAIPCVVTIHDASPDFYERRFPRYFPRWKGMLQKLLAQHAARHSEFVLTNSNFARLEVADYTHVPASKIRVSTPGCPQVQASETDVATLARSYGFQQPYVFMLGGSNKHKNYDATIRAFAEIKRRLNLPHHLLLAGTRGNGYDDILAARRECGVEDCVHLLGYVPSAHLSALYGGAELFLMPSLYEGFGFPVLEAMELGVPTLVANAGSLPEVAGDAAMYFDPYDVDSIAEAMGQALSDSALRGELAERGRQRSRHFDWQLTAAEILECLRLACLAPGTRPSPKKESDVVRPARPAGRASNV
ncbi:MAG: glycosyltransferase family 4 protein [Terriglobales bacterium]